MYDPVETARSDLAFLKAVTEDRGPLPAMIGMQTLAPALIYGANLVLVWAIYAGLVAIPSSWNNLTWLPGTVLYVPFALGTAWYHTRRGTAPYGPSARLFAAAWSMMGAMLIVTVAVLIVGRAATGERFELLIPPMVMIFFGGAWGVIARVRRDLVLAIAALGSFMTAGVCASLLARPEVWLAFAAGVLLFQGGPGLAIILRAREPDG